MDQNVPSDGRVAVRKPLRAGSAEDALQVGGCSKRGGNLAVTPRQKCDRNTKAHPGLYCLTLLVSFEACFQLKRSCGCSL